MACEPEDKLGEYQRYSLTEAKSYGKDIPLCAGQASKRAGGCEELYQHNCPRYPFRIKETDGQQERGSLPGWRNNGCMHPEGADESQSVYAD